MNIVSSKPSKWSLTERAERRLAVDYARTSVRLEGFDLTAAAEEIYRRFVDGELDVDEMMRELLTHHKK